MTSAHEQLLANALAEYLDRKATGGDAEEHLRRFAERHPSLAAELRAQIQALDSIAEPFGSTATGAAAAAAPDGDPLPASLSGCEVISEIGSGGMGRVLLGNDPRLRRKVAIKMLGACWLGHERLRTRFMEEARSLARISHPNVIRVYTLGQDHEPPHFVMEYIEGAPFTVAAAPLALRQKVELFRKVVLAVAHLHQHGILHRDLKPGNILTGADLEPKILDFGLALQLDDSMRLTRKGEVLGTPLYFSPEQARGDTPVDARSDVFSLGVLLYEMLTGVLPFHAANLSEQIRDICEHDPELPRRLDPGIPGDLQNICLKSIEKDPVDRYQSALELARDLERFLGGEPVLAAPRSYSRLISSRIEQHLNDVESWRQDQIVSLSEYDALRKAYDNLFDRDDAWIMEFRRLAIPQVVLYLGGWVLTVGAALLFLFRYPGFGNAPALLVVAGASAVTAGTGIRAWKREELRTAIAYLLAFCLLLPISLLIAMHAGGWFTGFTGNRRDLEFLDFQGFQPTTNAQLWWALCLSLPAYFWLRRFTRASVFALVFATFLAALSMVTLLRMGLLEWLEKDPGRFYLHLIPVAILFFVVALVLERRRSTSDSRYFYSYAVAFTFVAMTGVVSYHEPYREWLQGAAPWTRGQIAYLFLLNALIYATLQDASERFSMPQMRSVAKAFRFVIPGHVLGSLLALGIAATARLQANEAPAFEARLFEIVLPCVALGFVLLSVPRQMKNFLASGLFFLAIGIVRLQQNFLQDRATWPVVLIVVGLALLYLAANHFSFRFRLRR